MASQAHVENSGELMPNLLTVVNNDVKRHFGRHLSCIEDKFSNENKRVIEMYEELKKGLTKKVDEGEALMAEKLDEVHKCTEERLKEVQDCIQGAQDRMEERQTQLEIKLDQVIRIITGNTDNEQGELNISFAGEEGITPPGVGASSSSDAVPYHTVEVHFTDGENDGKFCIHLTRDMISDIRPNYSKICIFRLIDFPFPIVPTFFDVHVVVFQCKAPN